MLIGIQVLLFLLLVGMIALWATYGFFSAFLHLIYVIASGVIALALWEPMTFWLLGRMPAYAHGVGLLAPFSLCLIIIPAVMNRICRMNLHMPALADQIGGGICGLLAGILAFGMFINGANFLPIERGALGYEPYTIQGNDVVPNEKGQLYGFLRINEASGNFFEMLSGGSMSPTGGIPMAVARPDFAKRAAVFRAPADSNQMKSAHPETVEVTGLYAVAATHDGVKALVQRATIVFFLTPTYQTPDKIDFGKDGMGQVNAIKNEVRSRYANPIDNGKPEDMINFMLIRNNAKIWIEPASKMRDALLAESDRASQANDEEAVELIEARIEKQERIIALLDTIVAMFETRNENEDAGNNDNESADTETNENIVVARLKPLFRPTEDQPAGESNFDLLVDFVTQMQLDLLLKDEGGKPNAFAQMLGPDKNLLVVDTRWNNKRAGTYDSSDKLRVAITQVSLQVDKAGTLEMVPPVGFSIEYSPNTKGRTFTDLLTSQHYRAYAPYTDFHLGWAFILPQSDKPVRFFARELRFDLTKLPPVEGEEGTVVQNFGQVAQVFGSPSLLTPEEEVVGNKVGSTGATVDISNALPRSYGGATSTLLISDKSTEPWTLREGKDEKVTPGRGAKKNTVRSIYVDADTRLIMIKAGAKQSTSLYGKAITAAENLGEMRVRASDGNTYPSIGYVKLRADGPMEIDIRKEAAQGGLHASELPTVGQGDTLYIYFQVPVGSTIDAYLLGGEVEEFEKPLEVKAADK